jgi:hypothetical protein
MAVAAVLMVLGLLPPWNGRHRGGSGRRENGVIAAPSNALSGVGERVVTVTVRISGKAQVQWDASGEHCSPAPGKSTCKYAFTDTITANRVGVTHYRVTSIQEDKDGGSVELERLDSTCTELGVAGGGERRQSNYYLATYGAEQWNKDQATWTYQLAQLKEPWRGPDVSFHGSNEFEISPGALPTGYNVCEVKGQGVEEWSNRKGKYVYESSLRLGDSARGALDHAFGDALYQDKTFQEKLHGHLDWSKRLSVTGHATFLQTKQIPIDVGTGNVSGNNGTSQATIDLEWSVSDEPPVLFARH